MVLACSGLIVLVVLAYLRPLQRVFAKVIVAEAEKAAALGETIFGIKTVKSRSATAQDAVDARVAEAGKSRLSFGKLANWPQTIVNPIERFMSIGIVLVGAYRNNRQIRLRGRGAVRLHDAQHARRSRSPGWRV